MAGRFDVGQFEHLACDVFHLLALVRVQAVGRRLRLNDRHRLGNAVLLENLLQQHLRSQWAARHFSLGGEAVSINMGQQQPQAVLGRGVGYRQRGQLQGFLQEGERVDHPPCLFSAGQLRQNIRVENESSPGHQGSAHVAAAILVHKFDQGLCLRSLRPHQQDGGVVPLDGGQGNLKFHRGVFALQAQWCGDVQIVGLQSERGSPGFVGLQAKVTHDGNRHALGFAGLQPLVQFAHPVLGNEARKIGHHPGITVAMNPRGQRAQDVGIVHHIAHVVQGHLRIAVGVAVVERGGL